MNDQARPFRIIEGGLSCDPRGTVQHVNAFHVANVDRFYTIAPAAAGELRGWVGHRRDWKWFFVVRGAFDFGLVSPRSWDAPVPHEKVSVLQLSSLNPQLIEVPSGYYTAMRSREAEAIMLVFSTGRIEESSTDNYRLPSDFWRLDGTHK